MLPWERPQPKPLTPREAMLQRLREGVPLDLVARAVGATEEALKEDPDVTMALAEGEIRLFELARDNGVTGTIRAALRYETRSWVPKAEPNSGKTLEDYLRD